MGRGAAFGDIDNDGDSDVVVANDSGPVRLLVNNVGSRNHWIGLRLVGTTALRDMLGARAGVVRTDGSIVLRRRARSDGSYASANDPRVLIGLGRSTVASQDQGGVAERPGRGVCRRRRRSVYDPQGGWGRPLRISRRAACLAVACLCTALACASKQQATAARGAGEPLTFVPVERRSLAIVSLPDLSATTKGAATQLRERSSLLRHRIDDPATTRVNLANGYGEMGKLLMAAEYRDSAEPCFFNAQALAPDEMRWPYSLDICTGSGERRRNP